MAASGDQTPREMSNVEQTEEQRANEARENEEKREDEARIEELIRKMHEQFELDEIVECVPYLFLPDEYLLGLCKKNTKCVICQANYKESQKVTYFECGHILHTWCFYEQQNKEEGLKCPLCRGTPLDLGWFPYIANSEMAVEEEEEEDAPMYPKPEWASLCVCKDLWFSQGEKVLYIRTCQCFYHELCFKDAFERQMSSSSTGFCGGCYNVFGWEDVQECRIKHGRLADYILNGGLGRFAIAGAGANEVEEEEEEGGGAQDLSEDGDEEEEEVASEEDDQEDGGEEDEDSEEGREDQDPPKDGGDRSDDQ